jgi:rhomboid family protein
MSRGRAGPLLRRYAVAFGYLAAFTIAEIVYVALPGRGQAALVAWASTSVHDLEHNPVGSLVVSALVPTGSLLAWPLLIALAMFGANHVLGNWRTALTCAAAHVLGTLLSECIVTYRVAHGALPAADRYLTDVGPSYVVVAAIAVALLHGGWRARAAAALDFLLLIFVGQIFSGLTRLQVAAVGHLTAFVTGAVLGSFLLIRQRAKAASQLAGTSARSSRR